VAGSLVTTLLQIYSGIFRWKSFENRLRFDRIMAMSLVCSFCPPCMTLIFNTRRTMVMSHTHAKIRSQRSLSLNDRVETNGLIDMTDCITVPSSTVHKHACLVDFCLKVPYLVVAHSHGCVFFSFTCNSVECAFGQSGLFVFPRRAR